MFATSVDMRTHVLHGMYQQVEQSSEVGHFLSDLPGCGFLIVLPPRPVQ